MWKTLVSVNLNLILSNSLNYEVGDIYRAVCKL
jgi:hypothetical protein